MTKRAIVMGASSGIGREVALILLQKGWNIGLAARRLDLLAELQSAYPEQVSVSQIDVTADDALDKLLSLVNGLGGVDLYFHASGIGKQNPELDVAVEINTVSTNALGFVSMVDTIFNYMSSNGGGHIAVISSIAGTKGLGPAPAYSATKALQNNYIEALEQLSNSRKLNIRFTDIRPGFVNTDLLKDGKYPMLLSAKKVAKDIIKSIEKNRKVRVIDGRYRLLTFFWKLIPRFLWSKFNLLNKT